MKERPIIFRPEMVAAINDGRKTQTRRVIRHGHVFRFCRGGDLSADERRAIYKNPFRWEVGYQGHPTKEQLLSICPFGVPGDRLWVRESYSVYGTERIYKDDPRAATHVSSRAWRSPILMPRAASRLTLEITDVRVQRVQEISDEDAIAEAVAPHGEQTWYEGKARGMFHTGWEYIHGPGSWDRNDWVWAITFRRVTP